MHSQLNGKTPYRNYTHISSYLWGYYQLWNCASARLVSSDGIAISRHSTDASLFWPDRCKCDSRTDWMDANTNWLLPLFAPWNVRDLIWKTVHASKSNKITNTHLLRRLCSTANRISVAEIRTVAVAWDFAFLPSEHCTTFPNYQQ